MTLEHTERQAAKPSLHRQTRTAQRPGTRDPGARVSAFEMGCAGFSSPHQIALCGAILAFQIGVLLVLGRPWTCPCGDVLVWQGALDPVHNSQQLADPYTILHIAFGCGLFLWLTTIRPDWPLARRATYAVASSAIWEIVENLPLVIDLFANDGSSLDYRGDSIVNSVSDTLAVSLGFLISSRLPKSLTLALVVALEGITYLLIQDSILAGILRLLAALPGLPLAP